MLVYLLWLSILGCLASEQSYTVYMLKQSSQGDSTIATNKLGVASGVVNKVDTVQNAVVGPKTIARLIKLNKYHFKANGTEYVLYPLDRIMQGGKCIGWFDRIVVKKDRIMLIHKDGEICAGGIRNCSTIVEIHPGREEAVQRSFLTESGNFKFKLTIPQLLDESCVRYIDLIVPSVKKEELQDEYEIIQAVNKTGKPLVIRFSKNNGTPDADELLNKSKDELLVEPNTFKNEKKKANIESPLENEKRHKGNTEELNKEKNDEKLKKKRRIGL